MQRQHWLHLTTAWLAGIIVFSAVSIPWRGPTDGTFHRLFFGQFATPPEFSANAADYQHFLVAVLSAVTIGWMLLAIVVLRHGVAAGERWAWTAVAVSVGTWFVIDSTASVALGFWRNAVLNVAFAVGLVPGMVALRRSVR